MKSTYLVIPSDVNKITYGVVWDEDELEYIDIEFIHFADKILMVSTDGEGVKIYSESSDSESCGSLLKLEDETGIKYIEISLTYTLKGEYRLTIVED